MFDDNSVIVYRVGRIVVVTIQKSIRVPAWGSTDIIDTGVKSAFTAVSVCQQQLNPRSVLIITAPKGDSTVKVLNKSDNDANGWVFGQLVYFAA